MKPRLGTAKSIAHSITAASKRSGIFPLMMKKDGVYKISLPQTLLSVTMCLFYSFTTLYFYIYPIKLPEKIGLRIEICYVGMFLMNCVPIVAIIELFNAVNKFNEVLHSLQLIYDAIVLPSYRKKMSSSLAKKHLVINTLLSVGGFTFRVWENAATGRDLWRTSIELFFHSSLLGHMVVLVDRFSRFIGIASRFLHICNKELMVTANHNTSATRRRLESLAWAHQKSCYCATELSNIHSFQMLIILSICFYVVVSECYLVLMLIRWRIWWEVLATLASLCWIGICLSLCCQVVMACVDCECKAKKFNILLYQIMIDDITNELSSNKKLRLHISMKKEVIFSACGFFNLDYTLIHSMVAAATTYLVILVQIGQPAQRYFTATAPTNVTTLLSTTTNFSTTPM